ncbi:MAG TPA: 3'(2'),5'-bisphosphate nucleotidase CysQ [Candidatus Acidoferrales bacterium]|nr:3'(2'),5'-bisphosphate nucleotidase CysQ [Candidatus Acidoferrales bacterium]
MLTRELHIATEAARAAGTIVRWWYESGYTVREKGDRGDSPVTEADVEADTWIRETILAAFPDDGWLSEETRDSAERLSKRRVWIVDPLDGTKEFIQHIPEYVVAIGLVENGVPVLGVEYNPIRGDLFAGIVGQGAWLNGFPMRVSETAGLSGARVLTSRSETARGEWKEFEAELSLHHTGSVAYKLGLIAAGRGDATFSLIPKNEWDVCAGAALITAAGGRITDRYAQPLRFNQAQTQLPGIIACNAALFEPIIGLLQRSGKMRNPRT